MLNVCSMYAQRMHRLRDINNDLKPFNSLAPVAPEADLLPMVNTLSVCVCVCVAVAVAVCVSVFVCVCVSLLT